MSFTRILTNVCADDLAASRDFYVALLGFEVGYDSDWYVQLRNPDLQGIEFGIIKRTHELVPKAFRTPPSGMYVTFVVPDVEAGALPRVRSHLMRRASFSPRNAVRGRITATLRHAPDHADP